MTSGDFQVPRSSKIIMEDNDYALVNVVLFKRVVDDFRAAARSKGYQIREYQAPAEGSEMTAAQTEQLRRDLETKRAALEQWCKTAFGEVIEHHEFVGNHALREADPCFCWHAQAFSSWVHVSVIRVFVESILRYGLPPAFQAAVVKPFEKADTKLRTALAATFGGGEYRFRGTLHVPMQAALYTIF